MNDSPPKWFVELEDVGLLVANVPWGALLPALRETSGESFEIRTSVADWRAWLRDPRAAIDLRRQSRLLAGELDDRSYVISGDVTLAGTADRITIVAARTGGLVVGYTWIDSTAFETRVAARGTDLLRYIHDIGDFGRHDEGIALDGESDHVDAALRHFGFDVDAWLDRGEKWDVLWTSLNPDEQPDAHRRLYFGPLRQRVDYIEQAVLEDMQASLEDMAG